MSAKSRHGKMLHTLFMRRAASFEDAGYVLTSTATAEAKYFWIQDLCGESRKKYRVLLIEPLSRLQFSN